MFKKPWISFENKDLNQSYDYDFVVFYNMNMLTYFCLLYAR